MARATKLTPALYQAIVQAVAGGVTLEQAARLSNISEFSVREWMSRGENRHHERKSTQLYADFAADVRKARAQDEATRILRIRQAGQGGMITHEKTTTRPDGTVTHEVQKTRPEWTADAWWLERTIPERYALKTHVDVHVLVQRMATRLAEEYGVEAEAIIAEAQRLIAE